MLTTMAVTAALAFTQVQGPGGLKLSNDRVTYGELGHVRGESKLLPGDVFFIAFDIEGIKVDNAGKAAYSMAMEVKDSTGKAVFSQKPANLDAFLPLGGTTLPARAFVSTDVNQPPGQYTAKVTVTDRGTGSSTSLEKSYTLLPAGFGIVVVYTSSDDKGELPAPPAGATGQTLWVNLAVVKFERNPATKQPDLSVELRVTDSAGQPTLPQPMTVNVKERVDEKVTGLPLRFFMPLTRAGKFTLELKATDNISKKTSTVSFPVEVMSVR